MLELSDPSYLWLLELLQKDARTPYTELAEEMGMSIGTVCNRIRRLREGGVIKRFKIELDYSKLGFVFLVMFFESLHSFLF